MAGSCAYVLSMQFRKLLGFEPYERFVAFLAVTTFSAPVDAREVYLSISSISMNLLRFCGPAGESIAVSLVKVS
jgi:hypothetical protein